MKTGFETDTPQLLVPNKVLQRLGLLERLQKQGEAIEYGTAGGANGDVCAEKLLYGFGLGARQGK